MSQEATAVAQIRDGNLDQSCKKDSNQCLNSKNMWKLELVGCPDRLDVSGMIGMKDDSKGFERSSGQVE